MSETNPKELERLKYRLNLILIALLCATTLAPCVIFYLRGEGKLVWMVIFMGISYLVSLLPKSFYDKFQLSADLCFYRKSGVHHFKMLSTNGDLINRRIRLNYPAYRNIKNLETIEEKLNETYAIEKSHTVLFVFCSMTAVYAFLVNSPVTAGLLFVGNVVFNFYPNLLQQYNRIRYRRILKNYSPSDQQQLLNKSGQDTF